MNVRRSRHCSRRSERRRTRLLPCRDCPEVESKGASRKGVLVFDDAIAEKYDRRATGLAGRLGQNEAVLIRRYFVGLLNQRSIACSEVPLRRCVGYLSRFGKLL